MMCCCNMTPHHEARTRIAPTRVGLTFSIFFLIACGLGYPVLNRFDPRTIAGLSDVKTYASMVTGADNFDAGDMRFRRFRVLVPWMARPFYLLARGRVGSWDPVMFGLLVANSLFIAGTAVLIIFAGIRRMGGPTVGLVGALLYMVNFAVPNLRLVGLVDAGEGFFLLALLLSLSERQLWILPFIGALGAMTKESFIPFSIALTAAWWVFVRRNGNSGEARVKNYWNTAGWILSGWALGIAVMIGVQWSITGRWINPMQFGAGLYRGGGYDFASSLRDRNLWYIFLWLLPTAVPVLKRVPKEWLIPLVAGCAMAVALDIYFGPSPGTLGRALFSIAGPVLSLASAVFLLRMSNLISEWPRE
jgi:hypothetical protein